jgi:hypothetical protein
MRYMTIMWACLILTPYEMMEGDMPNRAQKMIKEWLMLHRDELQNMWNTQKIVKLPPLQD